MPSTAIVPLSVTTAELAGQMAMPEKLLAHRVPLLCIPSFVADPTPSEVLQKFSERGNSLKIAYIRATPFLPAKEFFRQLSIAIQADLTTRIDWSDTLWANRDGQEFFVHIQNDSQQPLQLHEDALCGHRGDGLCLCGVCGFECRRVRRPTVPPLWS